MHMLSYGSSPAVITQASYPVEANTLIIMALDLEVATN